MREHNHVTDSELFTQIRDGKITLAGNRKLRIYGRQDCRSGKRMKRENRVFFEDEVEAVKLGYRPCGHCMRTAYRRWRRETVIAKDCKKDA